MVETITSLFEKSGELCVSRDSNRNAEPAARGVNGWCREEKKIESLVVDSLATHSCVMLCCYWTSNNFFNSGLKFAVCGAQAEMKQAYVVPEASSDLSLVDSYRCYTSPQHLSQSTNRTST